MIQVELSAAEVPIEAGGTAQLTVTILNRQGHDDRVFLEIEGLDVEWYALPVPAVNLAAGQSQSLRALFRVPRSSESKAGTYPFVVRARGMESGESGLQQASLLVRPYSALQIELAPRRITSSFFGSSNTIDVIVSNQGNQDETLDLSASDPENACAYEFETDRITVKPGRSETVPLLIEPLTRPVMGATRLYGFEVRARSVEDSYVSCTMHGQLERRALLSPMLAVVLAILLISGTAWAVLHPRPVAIHQFTATPAQVREGEEATLSWDANNLAEGYIQPENYPVKSQLGSYRVRPDRTMTYTFVASGGGRRDTRSVTVVVEPRPPSPAPKIGVFTASRTRIHAGDPVTLAWKVERADKIVLNPLSGQERDAALYRSQEDRPLQTTTYVITAKGPGGVAEKAVKVEVVPADASIADVKSFRANPAAVIKGEKATLTWLVENAVSIEIDNGVGGSLKLKDRVEVTPEQTTTYTLRALDDRGNLKTATVVVTVNPPVEVTPPSVPPTTSAPPPGERR